jgi:hypothetical protein
MPIMDSSLLLLQLLCVGFIGWGAFLCVARRERRLAKRRHTVRAECAGRREAESRAGSAQLHSSAPREWTTVS